MRNFLENLNSTQRYLVLAIIAVLVYSVATFASYTTLGSVLSRNSNANLKSSGASPTAAVEEDDNAPKTEQCPLNGKMHSKQARDAWEARRPLAVMIENHIEARPQSGLSSADVVYETVAEGGITRFMAVFYCNLSDVQVGPVRSARTYFLDWLSEYDALYAHVGGANTPGPANALGQIIDYKIKDLNQFSIGFPTFWRDYQRLGHSVATEHTMYSSTQKLWDIGAKRGWTAVATESAGLRGGGTTVNWADKFVPWKFSDKGSAVDSYSPAAKITVNFWESQKDYQVQWNYDQGCNCYKRNNANAPHMDLNKNVQLAPNNVIVRLMKESHANDGYENNAHLLYGNKGTGKALIFQNGKVIVGSWKKATRLDREKIMDDKGKEIEFVRGQIWLEAVPEGSSVTY